MNKIKLGLLVTSVLVLALVVTSGCQRSRYEMGKKISAPVDAPEYTEKANFQPPAPTLIH